MNSTTTRALEVLLNLVTLHLHIISTARNSAENIKRNGWWFSCYSRDHGDIYNMITDQRLSKESGQIPSEINLDNRLSHNIPNRGEWL